MRLHSIASLPVADPDDYSSSEDDFTDTSDEDEPAPAPVRASPVAMPPLGGGGGGGASPMQAMGSPLGLGKLNLMGIKKGDLRKKMSWQTIVGPGSGEGSPSWCIAYRSVPPKVARAFSL